MWTAQHCRTSSITAACSTIPAAAVFMCPNLGGQSLAYCEVLVFDATLSHHFCLTDMVLSCPRTPPVPALATLSSSVISAAPHSVMCMLLLGSHPHFHPLFCLPSSLASQRQTPMTATGAGGSGCTHRVTNHQTCIMRTASCPAQHQCDACAHASTFNATASVKSDFADACLPAHAWPQMHQHATTFPTHCK